MTVDSAAVVWRKSSRSGNGNNCVEVGFLDNVVGVRDSMLPDAGVHLIDRAAFAVFLREVKGGRLDR